MVMSSRSALFLRRGAVEEGSLGFEIHSQRVGSAVSSTSSLPEGPCVFNDKLNFTPAEGSNMPLVKYSVVSEEALLYLCARYSVEAGGFLPAIIAMPHPTS